MNVEVEDWLTSIIPKIFVQSLVEPALFHCIIAQFIRVNGYLAVGLMAAVPNYK